MTNQYESGTVQLDSCTITSLTSNNVTDFTGQCVQISLWEDILQPYIYAEIIMGDAIGLLHSLPIIGDEIITLSWTTPGRDSYKTTLHCYHVSKVQANDNQTKAGYILHCVSPEKMYDAVNQVQKSYNTTIDQIIADIIKTNLMSSKTFTSEASKGVQQIVFPYINPFKAIDMVTSRAASPNNKSSSYLFFENKNGYNFSTLENLMVTNSKNIGDKVFTRYTATATELQPALGFRTIFAHTTGRKFDLRGAIDGGALNNTHQKFDLYTKTFTENNYTIAQYPQFGSLSANGTSSSPFTPTIISKYGSDPAFKYFSVHDSAKPDTYIHDFLPQKMGFNLVNFGNVLEIFINGDSTLTVGDVITIELPKVTGLTQTNIEPEPLSNGNYLIKQICHQLKVSSLSVKYTQTLGLIRGQVDQ